MTKEEAIDMLEEIFSLSMVILIFLIMLFGVRWFVLEVLI